MTEIDPTVLNDHDLGFIFVLTRSGAHEGNELLRGISAKLETAYENRKQKNRRGCESFKIDFQEADDEDLGRAECHFAALAAAFKRRKRPLKFCIDIFNAIIEAQSEREPIGKA